MRPNVSGMTPSNSREGHGDDSSTSVPGSRRRFRSLALLTVAAGSFMATLNLSIVNVSLPTIRTELGFGVAESQFIVVSYVAVVTALLITMGRLGDAYGRRNNYLIGFSFFALGAAACALAQTPWHIVAFRAFQAVGASMIIASGPAVVTEAYPEGRARALGLIGVVVAAGITT
ncbi:MAG TPA: MFS transporter, partial [Burkholderiales bacterium]|nr:MFS transporter [Burkholderiales bacterium]